MQQPNIRFSSRVAALRLIVTLAFFAVPTAALTDRPAGATAAAEVVAPTPETVSTVEARNSTAGAAFDAAAWQQAHIGTVNPEVLGLALEAAATAVGRGDANEPATLTVIDFSQPSTSKRMWVYDLRDRTLLFEEFVAHGRNSGQNLTTAFSNQPESNQSSLGLYRTAEGYIGKHGYSLRLDGLEPGFNDRARERAIVIHGAEYVNGATAVTHGRLGRSLGCPAVRPEIANELIDAVKGGGLVFAYYPDADWLATSTYLN